MTSNEFLRAALLHNDDQRRGQRLMNMLYHADKDIYLALMGTEKDPFYDDDKLWGAIVVITDMWKSS